jgi:hypothetical protein
MMEVSVRRLIEEGAADGQGPISAVTDAIL